MTEVGGMRIGKGMLGKFNATWPFARLTAAPSQLHLSCLSYQFIFPRESIRRLSGHRCLFSTGLRIEHALGHCPAFLVFWTFRFEELRRQLQEMGYTFDDAAA
jgi:hypothetical protein